ncbi:MAG TPA: HAMP domain-containing sensor histidine kinase [Planctomycetaceae bacterium]|jgi:signal transduction histidine kinase|nr:HAMP domain-containing sensor histidine kinase [Planctomycetaceae bacterium]
MKLTAKIVSLWMAGTLIVVAAGTYFAIRHDVRLLQEDMQADAVEIGRTLAPLIQDAWHTSGEKRALQLIADADRENRQVDVRWVWLDSDGPEAQSTKLSDSDQQTIRNGGTILVEDRDATGRGFLHTYVPVPVSPARKGAIELRESLDGLDRLSRAAIWRFAAMGAVLVVLSAATASFLGVWLVGRPLQQLTDKTRRVGNGDLSKPVHLVRRDELAELGLALNLMCNQLAAASERLQKETEARIAALEQLRHADRLKTVGRLASGMAHELGTPMNVVLARAELIGLEAPSETVIASAKIIKAQIQLMAAMIRQLLDFGRRGRAHKEAVDLRQLAERTVQLLDPLAKRQNITLELQSGDSDVLAEIDGPQIQQVLSNLIENAFHAMPKGGTVAVRIEAGTFQSAGEARTPENGFARIAIEDQGIGIPPEHLEHIFDPFFTTKEVGKGTGLGLSIAHGIVQDHGGWIEVTSTPDIGSQFLIYLPRTEMLPIPPSNGHDGADPQLEGSPPATEYG